MDTKSSTAAIVLQNYFKIFQHERLSIIQRKDKKFQILPSNYDDLFDFVTAVITSVSHSFESLNHSRTLNFTLMEE